LTESAAGIATCGKTVFVSSFAMFVAGRAYEQIRNSVAYPNNLNVKIGATHGGVLIGEDGASHQCIEDISLMRTIPNMTCLVPCDEISTHQLTEAALKWKGPVYLRFGRFASPSIYDKMENKNFEIGKGHVLKDGPTIWFNQRRYCESLSSRY
jgi:transketolase